jgi:hypothetical protein
MEVIIYDFEGNPLVQKLLLPGPGNDAVEIPLDENLGFPLESNP